MLDARARLLQLRTYLLEQTDERHSVTVREIIAHLELCGFAADRRVVYADIELLRGSGMDIRVHRRRANEYYLHTRVFERTELRLLADMVRASRFLSKEHSETMIEKLASLGSRFDAAWLKRQGGAIGPYKAENETAYYNAAQILAALKEQGFASLEESMLQLEAPIKALGTYDVPVKVHPDVTETVKVWVVAE